jgi:hypothetical protein
MIRHSIQRRTRAPAISLSRRNVFWPFSTKAGMTLGDDMALFDVRDDSVDEGKDEVGSEDEAVCSVV